MRLRDFFLHGLDPHVFLLQDFSDLDHLSCQLLLLYLHVLPNTALGFLEGLIDEVEDLVAKGFEFIVEDFAHVGPELVDAVIDVGDLGVQLQGKCLKALG